jgi:hypothetical protein
MEFHGDTLPTRWVLADIHLAGIPWKGAIDIGLHAEGLLAIFPIVEGRYRVIADMGTAQGDEQQPDPTLQEIQAILDQRGPGGIRASAPLWLANFHINERKVEDYRKGRVFVAGDAAHIHSPAGGQGMNTGIQDACNLAWKLALVNRGICSAEPLLASYTQERSTVAKQVLEQTGLLTKMGLLKGEIKQSLRNHIVSVVLGLSFVRNKMEDTLTEVSIGYPHSPLSIRGGERAPIRADEPPVGAGSKPLFALFAEAGEGAAQLITHYPNLVEPAVRKPFHEGVLWLVRPDGYIGLAATHDRWDEAAVYLDKIGCAAGVSTS